MRLEQSEHSSAPLPPAPPWLKQLCLLRDHHLCFSITKIFPDTVLPCLLYLLKQKSCSTSVPTSSGARRWWASVSTKAPLRRGLHQSNYQLLEHMHYQLLEHMHYQLLEHMHYHLLEHIYYQVHQFVEGFRSLYNSLDYSGFIR